MKDLVKNLKKIFPDWNIEYISDDRIIYNIENYIFVDLHREHTENYLWSVEVSLSDHENPWDDKFKKEIQVRDILNCIESYVLESRSMLEGFLGCSEEGIEEEIKNFLIILQTADNSTGVQRHSS